MGRGETNPYKSITNHFDSIIVPLALPTNYFFLLNIDASDYSV